ncbi:serine/threonine-protein kinase [Mesoterricola silvestris]|uniref:Non-specific serine/threonine protein kinase n=1 Tax=Mesoterricola silvestris TaxID=2927979 RepID=A0AA48GIK0_9BACT|nr:serine/threonine-protein kinase [Mesoterricola silvestris]BDU71937.1 hypothetical protein METEAL_11110 [Mesoterricola silvestris]
MRPTMSWYRSLGWKFFLRQGVMILVLVSLMLGVAFSEAEHGARVSADASLSSASQVLERAFEQQGRSLDAGLEVFTQYSGNLALVEQALEAGAGGSLKDTLVENLPRLGAEIAAVVRPDGTLLAGTDPGIPGEFSGVGIIQMALAPDEARAAGYPGPYYRGFLPVDWGGMRGVYHAVARPLRTPGGAPLGAMLVGARVDGKAASGLRRLAIAAPRRGDPSAHLALLSHFRTLGSTLDNAGPLDLLLARDTAFLATRARILDSHSSPVLPFKVDGRTYLGMISPLRGVNALDLEMSAFLLMPKEPLLAPFRTLQRAILGVGVGGILLALGLSLRSARSVTAPLQALATAAEALAAGESPEALPASASLDEVGLLTQTFRSMLAELRAKDQLLALLDSARRPDGETGTSPAYLPPAQDDQLPPGLQDGQVFASRYRVLGLLGRGGMGIVLRVQDLQLDEEVAMKVIRPGLASRPLFLEQLKQEIRLARRITHKFVLRTHDFGESGGIPYVTMEYLKGVTLRALLDDRERLPVPLVIRVARQVAEGLEAAHAVGVVHRDIKPMNVLFDVRGDAKIMDFGLATPLDALRAGDEGGPMGTPRYMSPEQVRGEQAGACSDLYALGVMIFELCTGGPPFENARVDELLAMHLEAPIPSMAGRAPDLPRDLDFLVTRLMAKRKEDRPQSAAEVVEILKLIAAGGEGSLSRL